MSRYGTGEIIFEEVEETTTGTVGGVPQIDRLAITSRYTGTIEGESHQALLVLYRNDNPRGRGWGTGLWVGLEQVSGRIGDRAGCFAILQRGGFDNAEATEGAWHGTWEVVAGSGTGELSGLRGGGRLTYHQRPPRGEYTVDEELTVRAASNGLRGGARL